MSSFGCGCGGVSIVDKRRKNAPNCSRRLYIRRFEELPINFCPWNFISFSFGKHLGKMKGLNGFECSHNTKTGRLKVG